MRRDPGPARRGRLPVTMATMTPGDCGSVDRDAEAIAAVRRGRGPGVGRPDRGRLRLPGVPRPGDLRRRRVAPAGRRGPPAGPARPRPDRPAGRLPLRPRGDQPPGPRRLLRRHPAQLQDPPVGAGPAPAEDPAPLLRGRHRGARPRRPAPARRLPRRRLEGGRPQAADARLPRQPARLAPEAARDRRIPRRPGPMGGPPRGRDRRRPRRGVPPVPRPRLPAATTGCSRWSARTGEGRCSRRSDPDVRADLPHLPPTLGTTDPVSHHGERGRRADRLQADRSGPPVTTS